MHILVDAEIICVEGGPLAAGGFAGENVWLGWMGGTCGGGGAEGDTCRAMVDGVIEHFFCSLCW